MKFKGSFAPEKQNEAFKHAIYTFEKRNRGGAAFEIWPPFSLAESIRYATLIVAFHKCALQEKRIAF